MAISYIGAGTPGATSATLPAGTTSGDWVFCFAYRGAAATAPTLPASWTQVTKSDTLPAHIAGYRIYDGVWTMPTWTNASRVVSATVRPSSGHALQIGVSISEAKSQTNVVWPTSTLVDTGGTSCAWRGVVHTRPDAVIGTPTGWNVVDANGTQPGYATFYKQNVTDLNTQTVTVARATTYTTCQFEVRDTTSLTQVSASRATTWKTSARVTAATRSTTWDVAAVPATSVSASRSTTWTTFAPITATRPTTWTTFAQVTANRATTWQTAALVGANRATTWNVAGVAVTGGVNVKTWNGAAFVTAPIKTWNGAAFVDALGVKTWNGSTFV